MSYVFKFSLLSFNGKNIWLKVSIKTAYVNHTLNSITSIIYNFINNYFRINTIIPYLYSTLYIPYIRSKVLYISNSLHSCTDTHVKYKHVFMNNHSNK